MLFHMLQQYRNIKHAIINDINSDLITAYKVVKTNPDELISNPAKFRKTIWLLKVQMLGRNFT